MAFGTLTIGRLTLRETFTLSVNTHATTGVKTLYLNGSEGSAGSLTEANVRQRQEDILGLRGKVVQITFTDKSDHNGYYQITDTNTDLVNYGGSEFTKLDWTISARKYGAENETDIESRLTSVLRTNDFSLTGERIHAPSVGAYGYYTGTSSPSGTVSRTGSDGVVTVYRSVPASVNPRWGASLTNFPLGRARVKVNDVERSGENLVISTSDTWEISNSLVKVTAAPATTTVNPNPFFETNATGWSANGGSVVRSTAQSHEGTASLLLTPSGAASETEAYTDQLTVTRSQPYRVSAWVRCASSRNVFLQINWMQSGSFHSNSLSSAIPVVANTWTFIEFTANAPDIANLTAQAYVKMTGTPPGTDLLYIDEAKLAPAGGLLTVMSYDGTSWEAKNWNINVTSALSSWSSITVLRNDFEMVTLRLLNSGSPGRTILDISLRRGSRIAECYLQTNTAATLGASLHITETTTNNAATGYIVATSNDSQGNKVCAGSARTFTGSTTGAISKAAATSMDFWLGSVVAGSSAVSGDAATDLRNQYVMSVAEQTMAVRR